MVGLLLLKKKSIKNSIKAMYKHFSLIHNNPIDIWKLKVFMSLKETAMQQTTESPFLSTKHLLHLPWSLCHVLNSTSSNLSSGPEFTEITHHAHSHVCLYFCCTGLLLPKPLHSVFDFPLSLRMFWLLDRNIRKLKIMRYSHNIFFFIS